MLVWAVPLSLATTYGIASLFFPLLTEMFHFSRFYSDKPMCSACSESDLSQTRVFPFRNPRLSLLTASRGLSQFCHVFHRLVSPRHSLIALNDLIGSIAVYYRRLIIISSVYMAHVYTWLNCQRTGSLFLEFRFQIEKGILFILNLKSEV